MTLSLGTKDPAEAKRRFSEELAKLEARWAALRQGSRSLTEIEAHGLAREVHDWWLQKHQANPSEQSFWRTDLGGKLWAALPAADARTLLADFLHGSFDPERQSAREMKAWCVQTAERLLGTRGLIVDEVGRERLAKAVAAAVQRASLALARYAQGEFDGVPVVATTQALSLAVSKEQKAVSFEELVKGWAAEKHPAPKTLYEWKRVIGQFAAFLGHEDAARLTPDDVIRWKEALIAEGLSPKTISDGKLVAVRTILQWGADNRRLTNNPAERVRMNAKRKAAETIRGFSDEEAAIVLRAALGEADPVLRWVPWLCAYSGARVSEVCQLRREDVRQIEGIWCMKFDPEAGPLKTASSERAVPLHQALLDSGFLTFARSVASGPLFADLRPDKFGKRGGNGTKVLGRWVRGLGLTDERLAPNHSWRHRVKTLGRRYRLASDIVNAITGHGTRTVADQYGEFEMAALHRELMKIPALVSSSSA
ncbi:integrase [Methylobacterium sp. BE186]|nr:integrase [Methylobacterium sp. BE186]